MGDPSKMPVLCNSFQIVTSVFLVIYNITPANSKLELDPNIPVSHYLVNTSKQCLNACDNVLVSSVLAPLPSHSRKIIPKITTVRKVDTKLFYLSLSLLVCGDVHPCPGPAPATRTPRFPCIDCRKAVRKNSKAISCDVCKQWVHIKCCNFSVDKYNSYVANDTEFSFTCGPCLLKNLPFGDSDLDEPSFETLNSQETFGNFVNDKSHFECFKKKGLHFIHINARSILPKMSEIRLIASNSKATVIGVSESWLDETVNDSEIAIENYCIYRKDRDRNGGGVCIYVRSDFAFNTRHDLQAPDLEAVWIELMLPKTKPILICIGYRPPKQHNFFDLMESRLLEYDNLADREFYFLGDVNVNLQKHNKKQTGLNSVLNNWSSIFDLTQLITEPTRISDSSESLLDHIYVSNNEKIAQSGTINLGLSDHSLIYCTRKTVKALFRRHNTVKLRSMKNYSADKLNSELRQLDWTDFYQCDDVDLALSIFSVSFTKILDKIAPIKCVRIKQNTEPWITDEILQLIHNRDELLYKFRKFRNSKNSDIYSEYCKIRNKVQRLVKQSKKEYFNSQVDEYKQKPRLLWKCLRQLGYSNKTKEKSKIGLNIENEICFEDAKVANCFNLFFTSIAETLVKKLPKASNLFGCHQVNNYYKNKGVKPNIFSLKIVEPSLIEKHLKSLNKTKSTGLDGLPAKFLNDSAESINIQVSHLVNLSIKSCTVPTEMKNAKVIPLYKKESKFDVSNYRPVSVLSALSKILERVVYDQLEKYLTDNNLMYEFQSGFRSQYSTDTCLIHLTDYVRNETSQGNYTGMVLIDLRKAFDTVNHEILCSKLKSIGLNKNSVEWFSSYLGNRQQLVECNGTKSEFADITCGVPQGSILGPLLFSIYVNDMDSSIKCKLLLYADDSALIVSHKDITVIESQLSSDLENLSNWLIDNKLSLHLGKTESILFGSKRKLKKHSKLNIQCKGVKINSNSEVKYLGAFLDQTLSSESMVRNILKNTNSRLKYLYRQASFLNKDSKKTLSQSLIQSQFDYSCSSWYTGCSETSKKKLQVCQNKIARFVLNLPPRSHIGPEELDNIGWLDVQHRVSQLKLNHVFTIYTENCPSYMLTNFSKVSAIHRYATRASNFNFHIPQVNSVSKQSFYYSGIKTWNALPNLLKNITVKDNFKKELKTHLRNEMYRKEAEVFFYY